jgi:thioester reductase-like protein
VSARSEAALRVAHADLARWVEHAEPRLPDLAFTLQTGRRAFSWRSAAIVSSTGELTSALGEGAIAAVPDTGSARIAMMFPGQGAQHVGMSRRVFEHSEVFRRAFDQCSQLFARELGLDLTRALFREEGEHHGAQTWPTTLTQASVFSIDYALAEWWLSLGIRPTVVLGHSLGEYVAACVAGVFDLKTATSLVGLRARLMERAPAGAMVSVRASESDLLSLLAGQSDISLAAVNAPNACVLSGVPDAIERCVVALQRRSISTQPLAVAKAFHSASMDPLLPEFAVALRSLHLEAPRLPIVSSLTGQLLTPTQATDPMYWCEQLRHTVRFADAVRTAAASASLLLEVGPDRQLTACARQTRPGMSVIASSPRAGSGEDDQASLLAALGELWKAGIDPRWDALWTASLGAIRVAAPGHHFERRRYWISPSLPVNRVAPDPEPAAATSLPRDTARQRIRELWVEVLGASTPESHDFFSAGGESLTASQLIGRVNRDLGLRLSVQDLFAAPTLSGLTDRALGSAACDVNSGGRPHEDQRAPSAASLMQQDLRREVEFSPEPQPRARVLLTGGTGFLGSYLLRELLERTDYDVACLVRADNQMAGLERLRAAAIERGLWNEKHADRVRVVLGDVAEERFGLSEPEYLSLADQIAAVYHAAAQVNFLFPYEALREVNVLGVDRALRFSCDVRAKPIHYMSSTALFEAPECVELGSVREDSQLPAQLSLPTGYQRSKWVAETLVRRAAERGVKAVIYRIGSLWGDSQSGDCNLSDFSLRMLAGCASLGAAPELDISLQPAPVDLAVAAIVRLSREPWPPGRVFHVVGPEGVPFKSLVDWVRALGYPIDCERYDIWRARARPTAAQKALEPFEPILGEGFRPAWPRVECSATRVELERLGTDLRSVRRADLDLYLKFFERKGLARKLPSTQKGNAMMKATTQAEGKIWDVPFRLGLYDIWTPLNFDRSIQESVRSVLAESQGHILDIGCGTGRSLLFAQDWLKNGGRLTGLDISPGGLHAARARAKALSIEHKVTLVEGDMQRMTDVLQGPFDGALSHFSVYTLPSAEGRRRVFAQAAQLIKPGGRFCVTVPGERYTGSSLVRDARPLERQRNRKSLRDRIVREWVWLPFLEVATKRFVERRLDAGVFHRFGADELKSELEQAGFREVSIAPVATMGAYSAVGIR